MNHDDCVPTETAFTRAHTHEGQKGSWLFPGEATQRDLNKARASGWVPPAERPHPPGKPTAQGEPR